jgi:DNA-binding MarR family transcriptional regulator
MKQNQRDGSASTRHPIASVPDHPTDPADLHNLSHRPGFLLRKAHQVAVAIFAEEIDRITLTPPQHNVLSAVNANPGCHQTEVSKMVGYDRATVGAVLAGLETRELIVRSGSAEDRRVKTLKLTRRGKRLLDTSTAAMDRINQRIVAPLAPHERELFTTLLAKIAFSHSVDPSTLPPEE